MCINSFALVRVVTFFLWGREDPLSTCILMPSDSRLSCFYLSRSHYGLFLGLLALDISSHWLQMFRYVSIRILIFLLRFTYCDYKNMIKTIDLIYKVDFIVFTVLTCRARQAIRTWATARALCFVFTINIVTSWDTVALGLRYKVGFDLIWSTNDEQSQFSEYLW